MRNYETIDNAIAIIPFVGREQSEEASWLGALLSRQLIRFVQQSGLTILPYRPTIEKLKSGRYNLPLQTDDISRLHNQLRLSGLVHGRFTLDEQSKMLGVQLSVERPGVSRVPFEVATPIAGFSKFMQRLALALIEELQYPISAALRAKISTVPCTSNFEAFRQISRAYAIWGKGQNELALASVEAALTLDSTYEEAVAIRAAIARNADDTLTTQKSFMRWADIATEKNQPLVKGERLLMLGHWLTEQGEWDEGRKTYSEAGHLFQRESHEYGRVQAANNIANIDLMRGQVEPAIQAYRRSLRFFQEDAEAQPDMAITYFNLSVAHKSYGQRKEAHRAINEALKLSRDLKDTHLEALCIAQRGAINDDAGQWESANTDYEQAARLLDVLGDDHNRAIIRSHQGLLAKQQGAYPQAERLMREALETFGDQGDVHARSILYLNLADLYYSMKRYKSSEEYAQQAFDSFSTLGSEWRQVALELLDALKAVMPPPPQTKPPQPSQDGPSSISSPSEPDNPPDK